MSHACPSVNSRPYSNLGTMPNELQDQIVSFAPDSIRALRTVSRALKDAGQGFLQENAEEIRTLCSAGGSTLYCLIKGRLAIFSPQISSGRSDIQWHFALTRCVRAFDLPPANCPDTILHAREVDRYNSWIENHNLERVWDRVEWAIRMRGLFPDGLPADNAPADTIREWMDTDAGRQALQRITDLNLRSLNLTSVPMEIGSCTGLQMLLLDDNLLVSLPETLFRELTGLVGLFLGLNRLVSLPETPFQGLRALRFIQLEDNQLPSLPRTLFRGLTALELILLSRNRLVSLPETLFQGLTALNVLHLESNRLVSLPETFCEELRDLQGRLYLYDNPGLLFFHEGLQQQNNLECLASIRAFFNYRCTTDFSRCYRLAAGNAPLDAIRASFLQLPDTIKNPIYRLVWEFSDRPEVGDPQWGEHHTFDSMPIFAAALKRYVMITFERLGGGQKNAVYGSVFMNHRKAQRASGVPENMLDSTSWGEEHVFDNILMLIDKIMMVLEKEDASAYRNEILYQRPSPTNQTESA